MERLHLRLFLAALIFGLSLLSGCSRTVSADRSPPEPQLMEKCLAGHPALSSELPTDEAERAREMEYCYAVARQEYQSYSDRSVVELRRTAFINHQAHSNNLLIFVITITAAGILVAAVQLFFGYRLAQRGVSVASDVAEGEVSSGRIYFRSSVTGVAIIFFSFLFFFLYIRYVYPLSDPSAAERTSTGSVVSTSDPDQIPGTGTMLDAEDSHAASSTAPDPADASATQASSAAARSHHSASRDTKKAAQCRCSQNSPADRHHSGGKIAQRKNDRNEHG